MSVTTSTVSPCFRAVQGVVLTALCLMPPAPLQSAESQAGTNTEPSPASQQAAPTPGPAAAPGISSDTSTKPEEALAPDSGTHDRFRGRVLAPHPRSGNSYGLPGGRGNWNRAMPPVYQPLQPTYINPYHRPAYIYRSRPPAHLYSPYYTPPSAGPYAPTYYPPTVGQPGIAPLGIGVIVRPNAPTPEIPVPLPAR